MGEHAYDVRKARHRRPGALLRAARGKYLDKEPPIVVRPGNGSTARPICEDRETSPAEEYGAAMRDFRAAKLRVLEAFEKALLGAVQDGLTGSVTVTVKFKDGRQQPHFELNTTSYQQ